MNVLEYRERPLDAVIATVGSVLIHLLALLLLVWVSYLGFQMVQDQVVEEETTTVLLSPDYFQPVEEPVPDPIEKIRKFIDTNPAIAETETVEKADYIGERQTQAASETPLDEGPADLPTQFTRPSERDANPETYNSQFNPGEIGLPPSPASVAQQAAVTTPPTPPVTSSEPPSQAESPAEAEAEPTPTAVAEATPASAPPERLLETANQVERSQAEETQEIQEELAQPAKPPATAPPTEPERSESFPPRPAEPAPVASSGAGGFSSQKTKTRIVGSLSREGKSAFSVKSTALGKYYAVVSKIIEKEWQRNCYQYREHIRPGIISMQFMIDKEGNITNPKPHDVVSTSPIQVGFTIKAIRKAQLPPMPADTLEELGDEKLELIYNFYF